MMKQTAVRSCFRIIMTASLIVVGVSLLYSYWASKALSGNKTYRNIAMQQHTENTVKTFSVALQQYVMDCGIPPSKEFGLSVLMTNSANMPGWNGPYLKWKEDVDAWGAPYRYEVVDGYSVVVSAGADGVFGTKDDVEGRIESGEWVGKDRGGDGDCLK